MSKIRGFSRDAVLYGIGSALGRVVALVMLPIYTRVFGTADYGIISLITLSYAFAMVVMQLGVLAGMQRFYYQLEGHDRHVMVTSTLGFMTLVGAGVSVLGIALSKVIAGSIDGAPSDLALGLVFLSVAFPIELMWDGLLLILRLNRRAIAFSAANIARLLLTPLSTYFTVVTLQMGITGIFIAKVVALGTMSGVVLYVSRNEFARVLKWSEFVRAMRFGIPGHPGTVIRSFMDVAPSYMLAYFAPLSVVGLFNVAMKLAMVLRVFVSSFNLAWNPFAFQNEGAPDEVHLYDLVYRLFSGMVILASFTVVMFSEVVLRVLTRPEFYGAAPLVGGMAVYYCVFGLTTILSTILYTRRAVRWATYLMVIQLVTFLGLGALLVPKFHGAGMSITLAASGTVFLVAYILKARTLLPISVPWRETGAVVAVAVLFAVGIAKGGLQGWTDFGVRVVLVLSLAAIEYAILLSSSDRRGLASLFARFTNRA